MFDNYGQGLLKPGLEFDNRPKRVIGLTYKVDSNYVSENPIPDPEEIKKNLVTSAEVTFTTSVDNSSTMPVGVHYHPKSVTGEEMAKTVQVCERCLTKQSSNNHIVTHETAKCNSTFATCLDLKSVCEHCKVKGQVSYVAALRCCDSCLKDAVQCKKGLCACCCN